MTARFQPGTHLQVRRAAGYYHHGIYISDQRVIQFGSGVTLLRKNAISIDAVPLASFEDGGTAKPVRHSYDSLFTGHHPATDEPRKVVERAEFLLKIQPSLPYNLIGHNCEIIANMCASGSWTESYQVRRYFGVRAWISFAFLVWIGTRNRSGLPVPRWLLPVAVAWVALGLAAIGTYNHQIKKFWDEIKTQWLDHERTLEEDPRNGVAD